MLSLCFLVNGSSSPVIDTTEFFRELDIFDGDGTLVNTVNTCTYTLLLCLLRVHMYFSDIFWFPDPDTLSLKCKLKNHTQ